MRRYRAYRPHPQLSGPYGGRRWFPRYHAGVRGALARRGESSPSRERVWNSAEA